MTEDRSGAGDLAGRVTRALEHADFEAMRDLLDPDARWGHHDDPDGGCRNRDEVLAWYGERSRSGVSARVTEVVAHGDYLLVGLAVTGTWAALEADGEARRWQVMSVDNGKIVDIRGFDDRAEAAARIGLPTEPA